MNVKQLLDQLNALGIGNDVELFVVSSDMGAGGDTFGPLDSFEWDHTLGMVKVGCTKKMCGDRATEVRNES